MKKENCSNPHALPSEKIKIPRCLNSFTQKIIGETVAYINKNI